MNPVVSSRPQHEVVRDIRNFLVSADALPSPQGTALRIVEMARDPDSSLEDIVSVVKTDPALTGFVLRAASAARFHAMRGTANVQTAVQRLGLNAVRSHALVLSLISQSAKLHCEGFNYHHFWVSSLHTGILTEAFALAAHNQSADDTFSLGLLSSIGMLAFATAEPAEYARLLSFARTSRSEIEPLEREVFGFDHHELSAVLLVDWQLPTSTADIIYWQRDPEGGGFAAGSTPYLLTCVLRLANSLSSHVLDPADGGDHLAMARLRAAILELEPALVQEVLSESLVALREWTHLVSLPMPLIDSSRLNILE
ncbi:MAG: HDOD domain-containing protein [Zoogloeaceae bacterium]|nr:HDOD domain-containing protein [Zoogloeaceae bacterium]